MIMRENITPQQVFRRDRPPFAVCGSGFGPGRYGASHRTDGPDISRIGCANQKKWDGLTDVDQDRRPTPEYMIRPVGGIVYNGIQYLLTYVQKEGSHHRDHHQPREL